MAGFNSTNLEYVLYFRDTASPIDDTYCVSVPQHRPNLYNTYSLWAGRGGEEVGGGGGGGWWRWVVEQCRDDGETAADSTLEHMVAKGSIYEHTATYRTYGTLQGRMAACGGRRGRVYMGAHWEHMGAHWEHMEVYVDAVVLFLLFSLIVFSLLFLKHWLWFLFLLLCLLLLLIPYC